MTDIIWEFILDTIAILLWAFLFDCAYSLIKAGHSFWAFVLILSTIESLIQRINKKD